MHAPPLQLENVSEIDKDGLKTWCRNLNLEDVPIRYREEIRDFFRGVMLMFSPLPDLKVDIAKVLDDNYVIVLKGIFHEISIKKLVANMLSSNLRDKRFAGVVNAFLTFHTGSVEVMYRCRNAISQTKPVRRKKKRRGVANSFMGSIQRTAEIKDAEIDETVMAPVEKEHREMVRRIIEELRNFDEKMPPFDSIVIGSNKECYKLSIRFKHRLRLTKLYRVFLDPNTQNHAFNCIKDIAMQTTPKNRCMIIRIAKPHSITNGNRRRKKRKRRIH